MRIAEYRSFRWCLLGVSHRMREPAGTTMMEDHSTRALSISSSASSNSGVQICWWAATGGTAAVLKRWLPIWPVSCNHTVMKFAS